MKVNNAKIKNVTVGLDDRDRLSARMTFESQLGCCDWGFILTNPTDAQRLVKLMNYTGVYDVKNLNGKIVRTGLLLPRIRRSYRGQVHSCFWRRTQGSH